MAANLPTKRRKREKRLTEDDKIRRLNRNQACMNKATYTGAKSRPGKVKTNLDTFAQDEPSDDDLALSQED